MWTVVHRDEYVASYLLNYLKRLGAVRTDGQQRRLRNAVLGGLALVDTVHTHRDLLEHQIVTQVRNLSSSHGGVLASAVAHDSVWLNSKTAQYREQSLSTKNELLEKAMSKLATGADAKKVLAELANKLTNKLIHSPTRAMSGASHAGELEKLTIISDALGLNNDA